MAGRKYVLDESAARKLQQMLRRGPGAPFTQLTFREAVAPTTAVMFQAPSGGIPARVAGSMSPGSATCNPVIYDSVQNAFVVSTDPAAQIIVYNWVTSAVCNKGKRFGIAMVVAGLLQVIADDCKDSGSA